MNLDLLIFSNIIIRYAAMAELVDAQCSGHCFARSGSSSLLSRTMKNSSV